MNSPNSLWLFPLIFMSIYALIIRFRQGLQWSWAPFVQWLAILLVSMAGIADGGNLFYAYSAWGLFILVAVMPVYIIRQFERDANLLDGKKLVRDAKFLQLFYWGEPGAMWVDLATALSLFIEGKAEEAENTLKRWLSDRLPPGMREIIEGQLMIGRVFARNWPIIIKTFEEHYAQRAYLPWGIVTAVSRAYLEEGQIDKALAVMKRGGIESSRASQGMLDYLFLPFFALSGADKELSVILNRLYQSSNKSQLAMKLYWQGRCQMSKGNIVEARKLFTESIANCPPSLAKWQERVSFQLARLDQASAIPSKSWDEEVSQAKTLLEKSTRISKLTLPNESKVAVKVLIVMIIFAFGISQVVFLIPNNTTEFLAYFSLQNGVLVAKDVYSGQYWRLISFLFLHANLAHLLLNLFGLWWFGRLVENSFGSARFLLIFFVSGIVSGLFQIVLGPELPAIGASGAVMGLFGASAALIYRLKNLMPPKLRTRELRVMSLIAIMQVIFDQFMPNVAGFAHIGGLVAGFLLALVIPLAAGKTDDK